MSIVEYAGTLIECLSTDVKPEKEDGWFLKEEDTGAIFYRRNGIWEGMSSGISAVSKTYVDNIASGTGHTHSNKTLLDSYSQSEINLADAVSKKHSNSLDHSNTLDHASHSDDQDISGKVDKVAGKSLVTDTEISKIHSNSLDHSNANDPTADQKAALAGSSGTPSTSNKFVTNADARNSDARTPLVHSHNSYSALANGATAMQLGTYTTVKVTPTATVTYTTTVPVAGTVVNIIILTSGTSSYTITFGTGFKTTGTLVTGTVTAKYFVIQFVSDGTNCIQTARTTAM